MTQLYIPQLGDLIRLTESLEVRLDEVNGRFSSLATAWRIARPGEPWDYVEAKKLTSFTLDAGTVLQFRRYFVSVHAKTNDIEVTIFASPRRDLSMKKNGGTGPMVKLTLPSFVLNRIHYEKVIL